MKKIGVLLLASLFLLTFCSKNTEYKLIEKFDKNGFKYQIVENDPLQLRVYTLENGLKVYLSVNKDEPRIQTFIAVKAGSTYDPPATTGLAHYLEHMMFKGTDHIATLNWEAESALIQQISDLYEKHLKAVTAEEKALIYQQIDSVSQIAATYSVANEWDKIITGIGAKGTNAYTSNERTVYTNEIASNELEKWLMAESERFKQLVLRLFHTELEAVYEEYNMSQDEDYMKVYDAMNESLFKGHPYGTQTVIGKGEHLKNPSMVNIVNYWKTYYVPNNMSICMSGDLDPDVTIKLIEKYWGSKKKGTLAKKEFPKIEPLKEPVIREVFGPQEESVNIGYLFDGYKSKDREYCTLIDNMLNNAQAGLIDLNLVQKQKVLSAGCYPDFMKMYGSHQFYGRPREGQTLEQVKDLILGEIEKIKAGKFDEWLIEAVINQFKLSRLQLFESSRVAHTFATNFAIDYDWIDYLKFNDELEKITKEEIVKFANEHYKNNYVVVYKRTGSDTTVKKIQKPKITPININRTESSQFYKDFIKIGVERIKPVFVDYKKSIQKDKLTSGVEFNYIKNPSTPIFSLNYIIDMGKDNIKMLPLAVNYLQYLGTDKYTPENLRKELYRYGLSFDVYAGDFRSYVYISGLEKYLDKGVELLENILSNAKPDQKAYDEYVKGILKERIDAKLDKGNILWGGLYNYGKYGKFSDFTNIYSEQELKSIKPVQLVNLIKEIYSYKHKIFYYGQNDMKDVISLLSNKHKIPAKLRDYPAPVNYVEQATTENKVFFVNYDMVQANIIMLRKDAMFDKILYPYANLFGEYFGSGLSSIVFQEIRESKGLAYSAYSSFSIPDKADKAHYCFGFVATQADKLREATDAMLKIMYDMPKAQEQYNQSKESILKKIETDRIIKQSIYWNYENNMDKGIDYDIRKDVYDKMKTMTIDEFEKFFNEHIRGQNFTFLVIGDKKKIDMSVLNKLGKVQELTLEEIFGY